MRDRVRLVRPGPIVERVDHEVDRERESRRSGPIAENMLRDVGVVASFAARWFAWFGAQQDAYQRFQESSLAGLRVAVEGK